MTHQFFQCGIASVEGWALREPWWPQLAVRSVVTASLIASSSTFTFYIQRIALFASVGSDVLAAHPLGPPKPVHAPPSAASPPQGNNSNFFTLLASAYAISTTITNE